MQHLYILKIFTAYIVSVLNGAHDDYIRLND